MVRSLQQVLTDSFALPIACKSESAAFKELIDWNMIAIRSGRAAIDDASTSSSKFRQSIRCTRCFCALVLLTGALLPTEFSMMISSALQNALSKK